MDLTPKQQTSEAIRQADTILVMTGQHPSVDQVTAVISLAMILRKFGKQVSAAVSDTLPSATSILDTTHVEKNLGGIRDFVLKLDVSRAEVDKLRYEVQDNKLNIIISPFKGSFAPSDVTFDYGAAQASFDLVIILGVPTRSRVDKLYEQNAEMFSQIPVVNIDYHRSNENYGAVNLIDPNASSLCEILVALSESLQGGIIDSDMATALLMGIVASTDRFTAAHTTSKSLTVAAQMMAAGAKQPAVMKALYRDNRNERGGNDSRGGGDSRGGNEPRNNDSRNNNESRNNDRPSGSGRDGRDGGSNRQPARQPQSQSASQPQPQSAPQTQPETAPKPSSNPDAIREQKPAPELPIISPAHIEMTEPEPQAAPQPVAAPVSAPAPVTAAAPVIAAPVAQAEPTGQLPPEMSPLGGTISSTQPQRTEAPTPLAQQLQHND